MVQDSIYPKQSRLAGDWSVLPASASAVAGGAMRAELGTGTEAPGRIILIAKPVPAPSARELRALSHDLPRSKSVCAPPSSLVFAFSRLVSPATSLVVLGHTSASVAAPYTFLHVRSGQQIQSLGAPSYLLDHGGTVGSPCAILSLHAVHKLAV